MKLPQFKLGTLFIAITLLAVAFFITFYAPYVPLVRVPGTDAHIPQRYAFPRQMAEEAMLVTFFLFVVWYIVHRLRLKKRILA